MKVLQVPTRHHLIIRLFIKFTAVLYTEHAYNLVTAFLAIAEAIFENSVDLRPFAANRVVLGCSSSNYFFLKILPSLLIYLVFSALLAAFRRA